MIRVETTAELISLLNVIDEQEDIEVKAIGGSEAGKSVFETICALSNEPELGGGTILLGVSKDQNSLFPFYTASGVSQPDKLSSDIQSYCSSAFNTPIRIDIRTDVVDGVAILRIDVPELPKSHKPAFFEATGLPRGAWRRIGPSDVRCNGDDLSAFYLGQSHEPYDTKLVRDADATDIDPDVIETYRLARGEVSPDDEHLKWSDIDLLHALGAARKVDGRWRPTIAGLLAFGKPASIRRSFPSLRVDYIRVPGNQWVPTADASYKSLDMRGPIIRIIPRILNAILDDIPRTFNVGASMSGQRSETPAIPSQAIREAVVNALMHRSYEQHSPVQIIRYANRLEIKNPGHSLKSQERFEEAGSEIRNPTIAAMLHETRFAETKGSGIRIMQRAMAERGLASPTFNSDRDRSEFSATFLFHHFLDSGDWNWLQSFKGFDLSEEQMKALIFVREVGAIDNSSYRSLNSVDILAASKSLRELRELGLLAQRGAGAAAHYLAGPELSSREEPDRGGSTIQDKPPILHGTIQDNALFEKLPVDLRKRVRTAALMQRMDESRARNVILELCKWKPLSVSEISKLLNKNKTYIQQRYISKMIEDGSLNYTKPEMRKHPEQKYVCAKRDIMS